MALRNAAPLHNETAAEECCLFEVFMVHLKMTVRKIVRQS
ncbi:hypothetical protein BSU04_19140 [Caballeronia sordidicola]|uniref:Uncharacterized protein n=1 Tax=Caballeronia sordidicola TaxID=196367 RepID=A0A226X120_CABSO|nr:hypothetical protein BSU04_19140 [Caballeronia sordidicola]